MRKLFLLVFCVAACSDKAASNPDAAADAGPDVTSDAMMAVDSGGKCLWNGVFTLESTACGMMDITAQWKMLIPKETFTFSSDNNGCKVLIRHDANPKCVEEEGLTWVPGSMTINHTGVSSCSPAACTFAPNDAPCMMGDRANMSPGSFTAEGNKIRIRTTDMTGVCGAMENSVLLTP